MPNPYHILEIPRSATAKEVHTAFRRKAKDLHPDTHADDPKAESAFKELTQAYSLLNDTSTRQLYDRGYVDFFGNPLESEDGPFPQSHRSNGSANGEHKGFFGWGGGRKGSSAKQGRDVSYEMTIPFETAVCGGVQTLLLRTGKKVSVTIPAGAETGQILRLKSLGEKISAIGSPGDALIELTVAHSPLWLRDGDNIRMRAMVDLKTAVLGGNAKISTPSGEMLARVPAGSNTGSVLRIKGQGIKKEKSPGDLLVRLEIVLHDPNSAELQAFVASLD